MTDTIFALATAPGRAAVAVLRLSGPGALDAVTALTGKAPAPRRATLATVRDPVSHVELDRALVLCFPGPLSVTGEDCAELHLHGGVAVIDAVTHALLGLGLRLAEPGEFTAGHSATASWTSPRRRRWPIWWMLKPRVSGGRRLPSWAARCPSAMRSGARH